MKMKDKLMAMFDKDKLMHFIGGYIIFSLALLIVHPLIAFFIVLAIAIINEVYDELRPYGTGFSIADILATIAGVIPISIYLIIRLWI